MPLNSSWGRRLVGALPLLLLALAVAALVLWARPQADQATGGDWTCSMHPQVRMPQPGKCPICGMPLVPVAQLASREQRAGVETAAVRRRELVKSIHTVGKIDYDETRVADITARLHGRVDRLYVEFTGVDVAQQDHLVDIYSPALIVAQEELLRALDSSERRPATDGGPADTFRQQNLQAARDKLRLWGILPEQIAEVERTRTLHEHITLHAPIRGVVIDKRVRVGQYVDEGELLYRIAELDPMWLFLEIYEYDISWARYGQLVDVTLEALPGESFHGMVTFVDPFLNEGTRTVKVRVNLPNADRRLKPGMYASARLRVPLLASGGPAPSGAEGKYTCPMHPEVLREQPGTCDVCQMKLRQIPSNGPFSDFARLPPGGDSAGAEVAHPAGHVAPAEPPAAPDSVATPDGPVNEERPLAIPISAVLDTGRRAIAYRRRADGAMELVSLVLGPRAVGVDDEGREAHYHVVREGLAEGDEVVVRAGFLLDSQRQIEGMPSLFFPEGAAPAAGHAGHAGHGAMSGAKDHGGETGHTGQGAHGGHQGGANP